MKKKVTQRLDAIIPVDAAGAFNQALMELGATVCLPNGAPLCQRCPAKGFCAALAHGRTGELPVKAPKKARRVERIAAEGGNWPLADQEFHWAIIKASHNEYMRRLYPIINSAVNEILQISQNRQQMQDIALRDNRMILEFLLRRDEAGARYAMSIHMKHLISTL